MRKNKTEEVPLLMSSLGIKGPKLGGKCVGMPREIIKEGVLGEFGHMFRTELNEHIKCSIALHKIETEERYPICQRASQVPKE